MNRTENANGQWIDLRRNQTEELRKYFVTRFPDHQCRYCESRRSPDIDARQFGDERFARFTCRDCGKRLLIIDLQKKS